MKVIYNNDRQTIDEQLLTISEARWPFYIWLGAHTFQRLYLQNYYSDRLENLGQYSWDVVKSNEPTKKKSIFWTHETHVTP